MSRNRTQHDREREAAEDLKRISEAPWGLDSSLKLRESPILMKKIANFVNSTFDLKKNRPNTHQISRRENNSFQLKSRIRSMLSEPKKNQLTRYRLSDNSSESKFSEPLKEKLMVREKKLLKKKNYSELRKYMEKDFYVGNHSINLNKKQLQTKPTAKSLRKGRLWLGRPMAMLPMEKLQEKEKPFFS